MPDLLDLKMLPEGHKLRTVPLKQLTVFTRYSLDRKPAWKRVEGHWKIGDNTFNELGPSWTEHWDWAVEASPTIMATSDASKARIRQ